MYIHKYATQYKIKHTNYKKILYISFLIVRHSFLYPTLQ